MSRLSVLVRPALATVVCLALVLVLLWLLQRKLIYFPDTAPVPPVGPGGADVTLTTADGLRLGAWLLAPQDTDRRLGVLVANGNGGDRAGRLPLARELAGRGFTVLLFDYRGYGGNPGSPSESGLALDAAAAYRHLADLVGADRVILYGESLGAAVATRLAVEHPPAALVLRSPFAGLAEVAGRHYPFLPVGLLLRDRYPVADLIGRVTAPTLVVYGTADATVPPEQSRTVADRAGGPVTVLAVDGADHNDASLLSGTELIGAIVALAERATSEPED
ncbi:fermentation-respiration switch protein FrsA (DUF1100 family) [Allocatelliglobosispora scoriae]|uniref:Fermentation-respiration switch protein FrsA (DUF1100 family) n=1 Tax=Allocatelliglobosispora scoriae TaxID=643052 RepID=A0A841BKF1_9ACTN|nr:alpha/beta fold hydrolase [Allocatelliglobosispora scoriae]MBB5867290.1 fermentation-respiration switch protein FrsA (DUF1100 family) [Allocatelliglobosispora scoriae]